MPFRIADLFSEYLRHKDINDYLDYLETTYPNLVTVSTAGESYEARPIKFIRISSNQLTTSCAKSDSTIDAKSTCQKPRSAVATSQPRPKSTFNNIRNRQRVRCATATTTVNNIQPKPLAKSTVLIDAGLHAREWATVSTALYCINQLVEHFSINNKLLHHYDFVIVPILNVDGYEFSQTKNRMWRKTRRPNDGTHNIGTDCNRNFSFHWQKACNRPSRHTYRGDQPFSEPETKILRQLMHSLQPKFYLTLHSYAKSLMYPYGFTRKPPDNWRELYELCKAGQTAIFKKTGAKYRAGNVAALIKNTASGGSPDYAMGIAKIPFVITFEISGGEFQPPKAYIKRIAEEAWIGVKAMCLFLIAKG